MSEIRDTDRPSAADSSGSPRLSQPSRPERAPGGFRLPASAPVLGVLALALISGGFLLGRHSAGSSGETTEVRASNPDPVSGSEGHDVGGKSGETKEKGVVRFTPEALSRAGLRVQPVAETTVHSFLRVTGTVEPSAAGLIKVTPRVAGKITSLDVSIGDTVRAGHVLATMSSADLATAQAQYRQASARVAAAGANLGRQRQLAGFGEFGQHKVQEARGSFAAAQGDVNEAQAEVNAARHEVAQSRSALAAAQSDEAKPGSRR